jgi:hypothetical protein
VSGGRADSKRSSKEAFAGLVLAAVVVLLALPGAAAAARIVVDSTATPPEPGECVLRDAITAANENREVGGCAAGSASETDVIEFELPPEATITILGSPLEPIEESTDIRGPGPADLTIDGNRSVRVFDVEEGEVEISGLRISDGRCPQGCGITNEHLATLALEDVLIKRNVAEPEEHADPAITGGAGILNEGTLTMTLSTVTENEAIAKTGTVLNAVEGAGIKNAGEMTIDRSTVSANEALADRELGGQSAIAAGAGIVNGDGAKLTIERSAIVENHAHASSAGLKNLAAGGGIGAGGAGGEVTIRDSTIAENVALATAPPSPSTAETQSQGGAIDLEAGALAIDNSTIARNGAEEGANLFLESVPTVASTILAAPEGGGTNCEAVGVAGVSSAGFNLESEDGCGFDQPTDQVDTNPLLAAGLGENGGPTVTIALRPGSPALDQGKSAAGETADQRGLTRPVEIAGLPNAPGGDGTDVGAFEFQVPLARITAGPAAGETLSTASATFAFEANEPAAGFSCSLDGGPATPCSSPVTLSGLANGTHTFAVVAVDDDGYAAATPTTRTFAVAVKELPPAPSPAPSPGGSPPPPAPPQTTIRGLPKKTFDRSPSIRFEANEPGSAFRCKLDDGPWKACTSPYRTKRLDYGTHTFRVVATNAAGESDPTVAKQSFKVLRRSR